MPERPADLRPWLLGLLIACLVASFWLGSRYPSLSGKSGAEPSQVLETPLGFNRHLRPVERDAPVHKRVLTTFGEWVATNRKGMTFGILLAAGLLALLPLLPRGWLGQPGWRGTLAGGVLGVPLGVCANCAAPIGQAMVRAGSRAEAGFAAIISSPSFNVIILSMLFALFPLYLVAVKLVSLALLLLVAVPVAGRFVDPTRETVLAPTGPSLIPNLHATDDSAPAEKGFFPQAFWVVRTYLHSLWRVTWWAVPLMLLAGLLGSALITLMPWDVFNSAIGDLSLGRMLAWVLVVAVFGALLPVPIAFDIVICAMLLSAGVSPPLVAVLLVTLGVFSVYPWLLMGRTVGFIPSSVLLGLVAMAGALSGLLSVTLTEHHARSQDQSVAHLLDEVRDMPSTVHKNVSDVVATATLMSTQQAPNPGLAPSLSGTMKFSRPVSSDVGFLPPEPMPADAVFSLTQTYLGGLASGDFNQDGWMDLIVGTPVGPSVYAGDRSGFTLMGGTSFRLDSNGPVAMIDLNNDRWPEIIAGTSAGDIHVFWNKSGHFSKLRSARLPTQERSFVTALAIADFDGNGWLDIAVGTSGGAHAPTDGLNRNWLMSNHAGNFGRTRLTGPGGETLSLLAHDLDGDHRPELLVGNDFDWPNLVYPNQSGVLVSPTFEPPIAPARSTHTTMSLDIAQLDPGGAPSMYSAQISHGSVHQMGAPVWLDPAKDCTDYRAPRAIAACRRLVDIALAISRGERRGDVAFCETLSDTEDQARCAAVVNNPSVMFPKQYIACEDVPTVADSYIRQCWQQVGEHKRLGKLAQYTGRQIKNYNLLHGLDAGQWVEAPQARGADVGGWSWNARFDDVDADTNTDLLITQGVWMAPEQTRATYYYEQDDRGQFVNRAESAGIASRLPTGFYLLEDFDLDGDRDLLTQPFNLPPLLYRAEQVRGHLATIELDDLCGNRPGIGSALTASINGKQYTKWIKASGGYSSMPNPAAHFGLGKHTQIDALQLRWPDGQVRSITNPIPAGRHVISRRPGDDDCVAVVGPQPDP